MFDQYEFSLLLRPACMSWNEWIPAPGQYMSFWW